MLRHFLLLMLSCGVTLGAATAQDFSRDEADSMAKKLAFIIETADRDRGRNAPPLRTSFTDREVNAYSSVYGPTFLPPGVTNPRLAIGDRGRVVARGIVDLGAVRRSRQRDWLDPLAYVNGSLEVVAAGVFAGADGLGVFQFESATVGGLAVPKSVLQELVRYYTTSDQMPAGFDIDAPFALPGNIRSISSESGRATIVQ
jgi:hypothetical protein